MRIKVKEKRNKKAKICKDLCDIDTSLPNAIFHYKEIVEKGITVELGPEEAENLVELLEEFRDTRNLIKSLVQCGLGFVWQEAKK